MKVLKTIIKPVVTEKSTKQGDMNIYAFWIEKTATKIDVKQAIKFLYGVDVEMVKIAKLPAKMRMYKKGEGIKRPAMKKAYVSLRGKAKLDMMKFEKDPQEAKVKKSPKTEKDETKNPQVKKATKTIKPSTK